MLTKTITLELVIEQTTNLLDNVIENTTLTPKVKLPKLTLGMSQDEKTRYQTDGLKGGTEYNTKPIELKPTKKIKKKKRDKCKESVPYHSKRNWREIVEQRKLRRKGTGGTGTTYTFIPYVTQQVDYSRRPPVCPKCGNRHY